MIKFMESYGKSKGVREIRQEDVGLGNLALPSHLDESASHHLSHMDFLDDPAAIN